MSVLNCLKYGYSYSQTFFTRGNTLYVRQFHLIRCTVKIAQDTCLNKYGMIRCLATMKDKVRQKPKVAKVQQKPRTADDDRRFRSGGGVRNFFMYTVPMIVALTIVSAVLVVAFGMLESVKDLAKSYYNDTPARLYQEGLDKCLQNSELTDVLGQPIKEVTVDGKKEKVKLTRKQEGNTLIVKMQFNIEGSKKKGTVDMKVTKTDDEEYKFQYLLVNTDKDQSIIIEDNR